MLKKTRIIAAITIDGPNAPARCFFIMEIMAKIALDNKINKGTDSNPNHAPSAANSFMSPPPKQSGCFLIKNNDAMVGKMYPAIAPRTLICIGVRVYSVEIV